MKALVLGFAVAGGCTLFQKAVTAAAAGGGRMVYCGTSWRGNRRRSRCRSASRRRAVDAQAQELSECSVGSLGCGRHSHASDLNSRSATFRAAPKIQFLIQINFPLADRDRPTFAMQHFVVFIVRCIIEMYPYIRPPAVERTSR